MADRYGALVGPGAQFAGVDQGIDFTGGPFPVYTLGTALVTRVKRSGSGWPGEGAVVNYKLMDGPHRGDYVYVAEDFAPAPDVQVGKTYPRGHVLGTATGSGKAPGIEVGWAQASGIPLAPRPAPRPAPQYTEEGARFLGFVTGSGVFSPGGGVVPGTGPGPGGTVPDPNAAVTQPVKDAYNAVLSVPRFLGRLTNASYLLRGLQIVAGAVLVLAGLLLLVRQVALAADLPDPATAIPVARALE